MQVAMRSYVRTTALYSFNKKKELGGNPLTLFYIYFCTQQRPS